jgi:hypothetical protein
MEMQQVRSAILPKAELFAADAYSDTAGSARAMPDLNHLPRGPDRRLLPFSRPKVLVSPLGLRRIPY